MFGRSDLKKAWGNVWKCNVPQKVKVFAWRAISNCLPTMENKKKRNLEPLNICSICGTEMEDIAHALCRCPHAKQLWSVMREEFNTLEIITENCVGSS